MSCERTPGLVVILSAPSGAGKSSIVRHLLKTALPLSFSVSATSRPPREGEREGVDYYFLTPEVFRAKIREGLFLEYEEVYADCLYGTLKAEVDGKLSQGKTLLLDVDVQGGLRMKKIYGDRALLLFIYPPSIEELQRRLEARGTESAEVIRGRMEKASAELALASYYDEVVVNDDLARAQKQTVELIQQFIISKTENL
jgi:guanylate kinase